MAGHIAPLLVVGLQKKIIGPFISKFYGQCSGARGFNPLWHWL
jgi:hypothetical protein